MKNKNICFKMLKEIKNILFLTFFLLVFRPFEGKGQSKNELHDTIKIVNLIADIEDKHNVEEHSPNKTQSKETYFVALNKLITDLSLNTNPNIQRYAHLGKAYQDYFELLNDFKTLSLEDNFPDKLNKLIAFSKENQLKEITGKLYLFKSQYYSKFKNDFQKAIINNQLSIEFTLQSKDTLTLASAYNGIASNYAELGINDKAIEFFHKTLKLQKDPMQQYTTSITMSDLYRLMHQYDKSVTFLQKAEAIRKENDLDLLFQTNLHLKFATVYSAKKDFNKALEHINQAETINSSMFVGRVYYTKGLLYYRQGDFESAIREFEKSLDFQKKNKFSSRDIQLYSALGKAYYQMDSVRKSERKSVETYQSTAFDNRNLIQISKSYFLKSYELLPSTQIKESKKQVYNGLKKIYLKESDYKKAFEMAELERTMTDSINNFETKSRFIEKELQYEYELKREADSLRLANEKLLTEARIEQKKAENRVLYMGLLVLGLILILALLRFKYQQKKKQIKIEKQNNIIESKQKEIIGTELDFLKAQINPHFLFNVINTIYFKINKSDAEAREALLGFSDILRYQLYECNQPKVPIEKEIKYLREYMRLQLMRKQKNTELHLHIAENVSGFEISPLLLIPFVENAFKYLSHHKDIPNAIDITLERTTNLFTFIITNSYIPASVKNTDHTSGGIGINNVKRRLNLLYPEKHILEITENENLYSVTLTLTLEEDGH